MPWDETEKAGFTTGDPWLPIGSNGPGSSVEWQRNDESSMLSMTQELLDLRRREPALSRGSWSGLPVKSEVLAYFRQLGDTRFAVLLNLENNLKRLRIAEIPSGLVIFSTHKRDRRQPIHQDVELAANEGLIIAM
jgi:alpha-glucosidase